MIDHFSHLSYSSFAAISSVFPARVHVRATGTRACVAVVLPQSINEQRQFPE